MWQCKQSNVHVIEVSERRERNTENYLNKHGPKYFKFDPKQ